MNETFILINLSGNKKNWTKNMPYDMFLDSWKTWKKLLWPLFLEVVKIFSTVS